MLAVFDSSALVKLLVEERGSLLAARAWDEADAVVASRLVVPEVAAALSAAVRGGRVRREQLVEVHDLWQRYLGALRMVELTPTVGLVAADLARALVLGGADALHLAGAVTLAEADPVLVAWDARLRAAAQAQGVRIAPAEV